MAGEAGENAANELVEQGMENLTPLDGDEASSMKAGKKALGNSAFGDTGAGGGSAGALPLDPGGPADGDFQAYEEALGAGEDNGDGAGNLEDSYSSYEDLANQLGGDFSEEQIAAYGKSASGANATAKAVAESDAERTIGAGPGGSYPPAVEDKDDFDESDINALGNMINEGRDDGKDDEKSANLNVENVSITAGSVNVGETSMGDGQGGELRAGISEEGEGEEPDQSPGEFMKSLRNGVKDGNNMTGEGVAKAVGDKDAASMLKGVGYKDSTISEYYGLDNADNAKGGQGQSDKLQEGNAKDGAMNAANVTINAGTVNMEGSSFGGAQSDKLQAGNGEESGENGENGGSRKSGESDGEISLEGGPEQEQKGLSTWGKVKQFGTAFKNNGGLEQLGTLANDIVDVGHSFSEGLYVDGQAPTAEWNANSQWRRQNIAEAGKKREERLKVGADSWANNKQNISSMKEKYIDEEREKAQQKYGNSKPPAYIESVAQERAETKAKAALKDMSVYTRYGVNDVDSAYKLYDNANKKGLTPEGSIKDMAKFESFNTNSKNMKSVNEGNYIAGDGYSSVEEAIPNVKIYFDAGYRDVEQIAHVDYMSKKLNKPPDFAMALDQALMKKGNIAYSGNDVEMKKVIAELNQWYENKRNGKS